MKEIEQKSQRIEKTNHGLVLHCDDRCYEVKGMARQGTQLRVVLRVSKQGDKENRFEQSSVDLYAARSRNWFASMCATFFDIDETQAQDDMKALIAPVEERVGQDSQETAQKTNIELTDTERSDAMKLLQRPDLMEQILRDFEGLGYADEIINKQLGYLVAVSRKLDKPLSLLIEARSSAGKSALQDAIVFFVPTEDMQRYSRITDQALFYKTEPLAKVRG